MQARRITQPSFGYGRPKAVRRFRKVMRVDSSGQTFLLCLECGHVVNTYLRTDFANERPEAAANILQTCKVRSCWECSREASRAKR